MFEQKWGRIIFFGSSRALKTDIGLADILQVNMSIDIAKLSKEYARYGITSNYLSLGIFDTPLI